MAKELKKIKIYYDVLGNTLNVWFDDPKKEHFSEEADDDVIINKDKNGKVIGFEKLNFTNAENQNIKKTKTLKSFPLEIMIK